MLLRIKKVLWGDLSGAELRFYGLLSAIFFFVIGAYWMLRELKNGLFMHIVGPQHLPFAKVVSIAALIFLVLLYSKLVDWFDKTTLVYVVVTAYIVAFVVIGYYLRHDTIGIANDIAHHSRLFGWFIYLVTESYGSIVVSLFWSYVASVADEKTAKRGYPVVVTGAQLGSILGSVFIFATASKIGVPMLYTAATMSLAVVPIMIYFFSAHVAPAQTEGKVAKQKATGMLEGLKLLLSKPYLGGILVVSTAYEVVAAFFDFLMNSAAHRQFGSLEKVMEFLGMYGMATNTLSFLFALIGTSFFIRRFGLTACLTMYPLVIAILLCMVWGFPGLWVFFAAQVGLKAISYALNNPCKEIMYLPTSKDVKFKAKSWIEVQGARSAKGLGAVMCSGALAMGQLIAYGCVMSLGVVALWVPIALFVGRKHQQLAQSGESIE